MSIDRRSFVQTAAAAVGGGVSFAGDAAAEERLQLAQAPTPPPASARFVAYPTPGPGAWKPPYPEKEGEQSQRYYNFLKKLFVTRQCLSQFDLGDDRKAIKRIYGE